MKRQAITFHCDRLILHGYCFTPDTNGNFPGVIICHPHPLYGGSMNNTVVTELASALTDRNMVSVIFNFRGVGRSQGTFGEGIAEQEDVAAAIDWLTDQSMIDGGRIGLAGYSFGGGVAIPVACRDVRIKTMALISPVLNDNNIHLLSECYKPKLFIVGGHDDVIIPEIVEEVYKSAADPKQFIEIPEADHFWNGYIDILIQKTADYLIQTLNDK